MTYFAILFVLLLIVGSGLVWIGERHSRHLKRLRLFVHGALGKAHFTPALSYFSDAVDAGLAIDEDRRRVCLWQLVTPTEAKYRYRFRVFDFADVLEAELAEDATLLTKTSRSNQVTGAVVGGVLGGGVGALIGGLSATTRQERTVATLELRLTVNDIKEPLHRVAFHRSGFVATSTNQAEYKARLEQASLWHQRISVVIRQGAEQSNERAAQSEEPREWTAELDSAVAEQQPTENALTPQKPSEQTTPGDVAAACVCCAVLVLGFILFVRWEQGDNTQRTARSSELPMVPIGHGYEVRQDRLEHYAREWNVSTERAKEMLLEAKLLQEAAKKIKERGE